MGNDLALSARKLTKSYGRVRALRGVDLEVRRGEIFGFLGPNGAGKTTTIRCLLDLIRPDGGFLEVLGLDPQKQSLEVRRRVGYLPGDLRFDENLNVEQTLRMLNDLRGRTARWEEVRKLAARMDLDLKLVIRNLSKGNKQKVGVVQALMHRPELLILDEPTFGLDPLVQQEVHALLVEAREAGATVFFSSHILSEVESVAERVAIIRRGIVVEVAETATLINRSLRRVRIRFLRPVGPAALSGVPGVKLLAHDGHSMLVEVEGPMGALLKTLAPLEVRDLDTERPTLEEIFLAYYQEDKEAA